MNSETNHRHQSDASQQERDRRCRMKRVMEVGGCGSRCGYARHLAALVWQHMEPSDKSFSPDVRAMSNRSITEIRAEIGKYILLRANGHAEMHFPEFSLASTG